MQGERPGELKRKLYLLATAVSAVTAVLLGAGSVSYNLVQSRQSMVTEMTTLAQVLSHNCQDAVSTGNVLAANSQLSAVAAMPEVTRAVIFTTDRKPFATYPAADAPGAVVRPWQEPTTQAFADFRVTELLVSDGWRIDGGRAEVLQPLDGPGGMVAGHVFLSGTLQPMYAEQLQRTQDTAIMTIVAIAVALLLCFICRRSLTDPVPAPGGAAAKPPLQQVGGVIDFSAVARPVAPQLMASSPSPGSTVLDEAIIAQIRNLESSTPGLLSRMSDSFDDTTPKYIATIAAGLQADDAKAIHTAAHTMKSGCSTVGASTLAELARQIETFARAGDLASVSPIAERLSAEFATAAAALRATVSSKP